MNTNLGVHRILFYGDSFVFGKKSGVNERLSSKVRFTGLTQDKLGVKYEVLEEGLRARTLYGENAFFPERDGLEQFGSIIGSHLPIDLLIVFLGTNNCNSKANISYELVSNAVGKYLQKLNEWAKFLETSVPALLLVIPPKINEDNYDDGTKSIFGKGASNKQLQIAEHLRRTATELRIKTLDAADFCEPSTGDGIHLDKTGNQRLSEQLALIIAEMTA